MGLIADFTTTLAKFGLSLGKQVADALRHDVHVDDKIHDAIFADGGSLQRLAAERGVELDEDIVAKLEAASLEHKGRIDKWFIGLATVFAEVLQGTFRFYNVDYGAQPQEGFAPNAKFEEGKLTTNAERAVNRTATTFRAVTTLIIFQGALGLTAELLTLGQVDTFQETTTNLIWGTGLGGLTSMAFTPQINASVAPLLERRYRREALAHIPGPSDLVRFQLREAFDDDRRPELLGGPGRESFNEFMSENGLSPFWADTYWAAHWELPSIGALNEMLHRGQIDSATWQRYVRWNDFTPEAVPWLEQIIFSPFTRVDARRMRDVGVLSREELLQAYRDLGFFAPTEETPDGRQQAVFVEQPDFTLHKAQAMVVWTELFNALPDLRRRYRNGYLSEDDVRRELANIGLPPDKVQEQFETIVKNTGGDRVQAERDLTKSEILRGVKQQLISFAQGALLLTRMGYSAAEARFLVQAKVDIADVGPATTLGRQLLGGEGPVVEQGISVDSP